MVAFVQALRGEGPLQAAGCAETIDWAQALVALDRVALDPGTMDDTLGALLKYQDDIGARSGAPRRPRCVSAAAGEVSPP